MGDAPYPLGTPPALWAPRALSGLRFLARYVFWSVKIHYNLLKVLTTVSRKYPLFLFRAIFLTDLEHHDRSWLLKIERKREEAEEINKDEGIKKAMEVQAPAVKEEGIPQPLPNLFTPTEIEAFKMIELAHI